MSVSVGGSVSNWIKSFVGWNHTFLCIPNSNQHKASSRAEAWQTFIDEYLLIDGLPLWQRGSTLLFSMCTSIQVSPTALSRKSPCDLPSPQTKVSIHTHSTAQHNSWAHRQWAASPWRTARFWRKFWVAGLALCSLATCLVAYGP